MFGIHFYGGDVVLGYVRILFGMICTMLFLFTGCFFSEMAAEDVAIRCRDGKTVDFPAYIKHVAKELSLSTEFSSIELKNFVPYVEALRTAAKWEGNPVLDKQTVFVHQKLQQVVEANLAHLTPKQQVRQLDKLYQISEELGILPLQKAFAYHMTQIIRKDAMMGLDKVDTDELGKRLHASFKKYGFRMKSISNELMGMVVYYLALGDHKELPVDNYLALHKVRVVKGTLDLSGRQITSLKGLDRIGSPEKVKRLLLNNNAIYYNIELPEKLQTEDLTPFTRFTQLRYLDISSNKMIQPGYRFLTGLEKLNGIDW